MIVPGGRGSPRGGLTAAGGGQGDRQSPVISEEADLLAEPPRRQERAEQQSLGRDVLRAHRAHLAVTRQASLSNAREIYRSIG